MALQVSPADVQQAVNALAQANPQVANALLQAYQSCPQGFTTAMQNGQLDNIFLQWAGSVPPGTAANPADLCRRLQPAATTSKSNVGLWVAGGIILVGLGIFFLTPSTHKLFA